MKWTYLTFALSLSSLSFADEIHRYKSFPYKTSKAVFLDFKEAHYNVVIDKTKILSTRLEIPLNRIGNKSYYQSTITFDMPEDGFPVFDSYANVLSVSIDGQKVKHEVVKTPDKESTVRVVNSLTSRGEHTLEIESIPNSEFVKLDKAGKGFNLFLYLSDNESQGFLEYELPASFEYDQVKMSINFNLVGTLEEHRLIANGKVTEVDGQNFSVDFPEYYSSSSPFFHILRRDNITERNINLISIDGRTIPLTIYSPKENKISLVEMNKFESLVKSTFAKAEKNLGPYPHSSLILLNDTEGSEPLGGGMEYCGAAIGNSLSAVHEVYHSWIGRGAMPSNGNAGWIDESVVSWMEQPDPKVLKLTSDDRFTGFSLPYYRRENGPEAYNGVNFISYLHNVVLKNKGGIYPFLSQFYKKYVLTRYSNEDFINEMSLYAGKDLKPLFTNFAAKKYVPDDSDE